MHFDAVDLCEYLKRRYLGRIIFDSRASVRAGPVHSLSGTHEKTKKKKMMKNGEGRSRTSQDAHPPPGLEPALFGSLARPDATPPREKATPCRRAHGPACCVAPACHARAAAHSTSRSHPPPTHLSAYPRSHPQHEQIFRLLLKISVGVTHYEQRSKFFSPAPLYEGGGTRSTSLHRLPRRYLSSGDDRCTQTSARHARTSPLAPCRVLAVHKNIAPTTAGSLHEYSAYRWFIEPDKIHLQSTTQKIKGPSGI